MIEDSPITTGAPESIDLMILFASWLNVALYTVELLLCIRYFGRPSRPLVHKIGVGVLIFVDTICTLATCVTVVFSIFPPSATNLHLDFSPIAVQVLMTYVSAIISQLFLCNLFFVLTGRKIVAGIIVILIFVHSGFSWASAIILLTTPVQGATALTSRRGLTATIVGSVSCSTTDVIIATCLAWKFWMMMAGTTDRHSTRSLLRRIQILAISSGLICASNTLLMMILLLKGSGVFDFFFACQGRVYALTLLGNFLLGIPGRSQEGTRPSLGLGTSIISGTVMFRNHTEPNEVEDPISAVSHHSGNGNPPKSADPLWNHQRHESLQLEELPMPNKADSQHCR
ncbi:hypothetical protein B0H12DRAFT_690823 [Mycena haematopus]|nr:hypothetical protein B0H12DRAFT_690823 [Mycena haematopus]